MVSFGLSIALVFMPVILSIIGPIENIDQPKLTSKEEIKLRNQFKVSDRNGKMKNENQDGNTTTNRRPNFKLPRFKNIKIRKGPPPAARVTHYTDGDDSIMVWMPPAFGGKSDGTK